MPYFIIFIVVAFCENCVSEIITLIVVWLGYFNSAIDPILYPLCNSAFKNAFRKMLNIHSSSFKNNNKLTLKSLNSTIKRS